MFLNIYWFFNVSFYFSNMYSTFPTQRIYPFSYKIEFNIALKQIAIYNFHNIYSSAINQNLRTATQQRVRSVYINFIINISLPNFGELGRAFFFNMNPIKHYPSVYDKLLCSDIQLAVTCKPLLLAVEAHKFDAKLFSLNGYALSNLFIAPNPMLFIRNVLSKIYHPK